MKTESMMVVYGVALLVIAFLVSIVLAFVEPNDPGHSVRRHEEVEMAKEKRASTFWVPGKRYFVRTVTMYVVGELVLIDGPNDSELIFKDASWIACTERFADSMAKGDFAEVEPYPEGNVLVNRSSIIDSVEWKHELPRLQK